MLPWVLWKEIDKLTWQKCDECGALFTDECMREIYEQRAARHTELWKQGVRAKAPGSCPACGAGEVEQVVTLGVKDKRGLLLRSYLDDITQCLKKTKRFLVPASS